jgi:glycosyltransferase involved in cell wall biosynthesis
MTKFKVVGDPKNPARFSSNIIIESLNQGAKNLGLYDENGALVVYDCIGNNHGYKADALLVCYELPFPPFIIQNCQGKPVIGVSRDNAMFALHGGYPADRVNWIPLGVDSNVWKPVQKKYHLDKFVVLSYTESLARSGLEILAEAFAKHLGWKKDTLLYIKDRNATPEFEQWIKEHAEKYHYQLIYDNRHISTPEEEMDVFANADCHFYLNRSTTWGMTVCQSMTCGIPTVAPAYSGPREFILDDFTGLNVDYHLEPVQKDLGYLQTIGMRNFFFPDDRPVYWAKPHVDSVINALRKLYTDKNLRERLSYLGREMGKSLTWERSAANLSQVLYQFGIK